MQPKSLKLPLILLGASLIAVAWAEWPTLFDYYQVTEDVQNFYWTARFQNPDLFPVDTLWGYRLLEINLFGQTLILLPRSIGYGLLFYLASFVMDPVWFAKGLVFLLMPLSVVYLFKLVAGLTDEVSAGAASLLFLFVALASYQSIALNTGVQRAFAFPLLIIFMYYLVQERYKIAGALVFINLTFYFPNFVLAAGAYAFSLIRLKWPLPSLDLSKRKLIPFVAAIALAGAVIGLTLVVESLQRYVPRTEAVAENIYYQSEGVIPLFLGSPLLGRAGLFDAGTDLLNFMWLLALAGLIFAVLGRESLRRVPGAVWHLLAVSGLMYGLSLFTVLGLSSFALYLPSRYTRVSLILVAIYFVGFNWSPFMQKLPAWMRRHRQRLLVAGLGAGVSGGLGCGVLAWQLSPGPVAAITAMGLSVLLTVLGIGAVAWWWQAESPSRRASFIALGLIVVAIPSAGAYIRATPTAITNPGPAERAIYEFVSTLPIDSVVMGDLDLMTGIPLFAQRSIIFSSHQTQPEAPVISFFEAYYAESLPAVLDFCTTHQVSHWVINTRHFEPDFIAEGEFFYQPWNDYLQTIIPARQNFILPASEPVFSASPYAVIPCTAEALGAN